MLLYIARRLAISVLVVWGAITVIFVVIRVVPGDPAVSILGPDASAEQLANLRERLGLNDPIAVQYVNYLLGALQGDFGTSLNRRMPALEIVLDRFPATAELALTAIVLAATIGIILGLLAGSRPGSPIDGIVRALSLLTQSLPTFWVGIMLILIFSRTLQLLPSSGASTPLHLILPAITLALPAMSVFVRMTRGGLVEVMGEEYITTARAKGLRDSVVLRRHGLRNTLIPLITVFGLQLGTLLGGTVITETVFAWPGVGRLLIDSILVRDYPVVQACVALIATIYVLINLLVDIGYHYADPRVRLTGADR